MLTITGRLRYDVVGRLPASRCPDGPRDRLRPRRAGCILARQYSYLGIEPDPESFAVAHSLLGPRVRRLREEELEPGAYDLVCAFEVLEHIEADQAALCRWRERVRPGGWLLISVPAHQSLFGATDVRVGHFQAVRRRRPPGSSPAPAFATCPCSRTAFPWAMRSSTRAGCSLDAPTAPWRIERLPADAGCNLLRPLRSFAAWSPHRSHWRSVRSPAGPWDRPRRPSPSCARIEGARLPSHSSCTAAWRGFGERPDAARVSPDACLVSDNAAATAATISITPAGYQIAGWEWLQPHACPGTSGGRQHTSCAVGLGASAPRNQTA